MRRNFTATVAAPVDLRIDASLRPVPSTTPCTAMVVCHGMGQQVPFETLDAVASAIADEHMAAGNGTRSVDVVLRFVRPTNSEKLYPRAELTLRQSGQVDKTVHLYEAYWAPLTEGVIGYTQTVAHILAAGFKGLRASIRGYFKRWMFGGEKALPVTRNTTSTLLALLVLITPFLMLPLAGLSLNGLFKNGEVLTRCNLALVVLLALSFFIRRFIVQYMGDVIIYVSSNEVNAYGKIRDEIKLVGLSLAKIVYGALKAEEAGDEAAPEFLYSDVVVVGHSLGSVLAYDTLNAIINQDRLDHGVRHVVERTKSLVTLGSPLDKTAFLFRQKARDAFTRDMLSAAYQSMILDYQYRPKWWINVFCKMDIISGSLEYYDDPQHANSDPRRVRNFRDPYCGLNPVSAHTDYWKRPMAKSFLYLAATGDMLNATSVDFAHDSHRVAIRLTSTSSSEQSKCK